ncbi:MAG: sugar ABC transporter ATP-binding protein [Kiritimatiellae bacterium]|nr:sugar ABC transporter ATP-binding protein [Kiritimatiellia bacterium]
MGVNDKTANYALEMRRISKEFPGVRALDDVTLRVRRGTIHALLGENGAGKSTLMKILDGVYPVGSYSGDVLLDGKPVQFRSPHDARLKGIGYVPQEIQVLESLSVAENMFVGHWTEGRGIRVRFGDLYRRAERLLHECGIRLDPRVPVAVLNASQRQLVMIARALSIRPSLLVLDEATASLTVDETGLLFSVVRHLRERGVTALFITHRLAEVFELADAATVLRDGKWVADFDRGRFDQNDIVSAMVGRKIEAFYPSRQSVPGSNEVLRVENLTVPHPHIAGKSVVEDVSFTLRQGEILGLGGLVGSGRSETVNAIYGRMEHTGRVVVDGQTVRIRTPRHARDHGIGLLPEERKREGLLFNFAIRENVTLHSLQAVSRCQVISRQRENAAADACRQRLSIRAGSVDVPVMNLSGGNQQKVVLSKVLMPSPKVLLLDEPTKGVDVGAKAEIYKLIMSLADQGIGIVVISSDLPELLALCDRIVVLARGRVTGEFAKSEANEQRVMLAATGLERKDG